MAGLSLVEMMISIAIGLIILAAVVTIFANTSSARNELERTSRQIENGRYAVELLSDDLRLAGFYGELNVGSVIPPLPNPCSTTAADWASAIPLHLQGYDNGSGAPACIPASLKANTDIVAVRRARTCVAGVSDCPASAAGTPYIQVSLCGTEAGSATPYVLGLQGTATFDRKLKNCAAGPPFAGLRQYFVNIYFISTDNGAGQNIPTLKRMELTGSSLIETPLVEGIEHFNIEYGIDNNHDGVPDAYTTDPTNYTYAGCMACTPVENWTNVVTAKFFILARNIEVSPGYIDTKTYSLGTDAAGNPITFTPSDSYRRHIYTSLVRIANPAGRRDTP